MTEIRGQKTDDPPSPCGLWRASTRSGFQACANFVFIVVLVLVLEIENGVLNFEAKLIGDKANDCINESPVPQVG